jgi:hypothetical protein
MFDVSANSQALLGAQSPIGGFGKAAGEFPGESGSPIHVRFPSDLTRLTGLLDRSVSFLPGTGGSGYECGDPHQRKRVGVRRHETRSATSRPGLECDEAHSGLLGERFSTSIVSE